ncbi:MAG: hypothetical protein NHB15_03240 [Methanosarcina barkeri]|nr:hypothetical protein [Methanosarcina sp. ERenArc_MAG2]
MPKATQNKISVQVYFPIETYYAIESMRNPEMPKSNFCVAVIEEALGISKP